MDPASEKSDPDFIRQAIKYYGSLIIFYNFILYFITTQLLADMVPLRYRKEILIAVLLEVLIVR
jgi:hypothetical protein